MSKGKPTCSSSGMLRRIGGMYLVVFLTRSRMFSSGSKKREGTARRRLGRNPRIPFSTSQVDVLEDKFRSSPYLSAADVSHLSTLLRLSDTRVSVVTESTGSWNTLV